jgi:hypothetical protein
MVVKAAIHRLFVIPVKAEVLFAHLSVFYINQTCELDFRLSGNGGKNSCQVANPAACSRFAGPKPMGFPSAHPASLSACPVLEARCRGRIPKSAPDLQGQTLTTPRYLMGCVAASQVDRLALWRIKRKTSSPYAGNANNAWNVNFNNGNVNFNNGNVNNNNRNNNNAVRLIRASQWSDAR